MLPLAPPSTCAHCRAPFAAPSPFCAQCGAAQPHQAGTAPFVAPSPSGHLAPFAVPPHLPASVASFPAAVAAPASVGPTWPYPSGLQRSRPSADMVLGVIFLGAGGFLVLMTIALAPFLIEDPLSFAALLPFLAFPLIGIFSVRQARRARILTERLIHQGLRCWGQVLATAPVGPVRRSSQGLRSLRVRITVRAFAAVDPSGHGNAYRATPQSLVAQSVVVDSYVSELQMMYLQPGGWCALLLDAETRTQALLDGFLTSQGHFVPLA